MPVIGERKSKSQANLGTGFSYDNLESYTQSFIECANDLRSEGVDIYDNPRQALSYKNSRNALKNFFVENSYDPKEIELMNPANAARAIEDQQLMAEALFDNDAEGVLYEYAAMNAYNPVIGLTFPVHKNIMMNCVFDKGAIPKFVATEPKFTISMEDRILVDRDGNEIDFYKEQYKIKAAIDKTAPFHEIELELPQLEGQTDILNAIGATDEDNLSIDTYISAVKLSGIYLEAGDINPETGEKATEAGEVECWVPVHLPFVPSYGDIQRIITEEVAYETKDKTDPTKKTLLKDVITGYTRKNKFMLQSATGAISALKLKTRLDTSSAMVKTPSVRWQVRTDIVEIPTMPPINVPVAPEEVKDLGALYNVNQLSKIMSLMKTALLEYKDTSIKEKLDESFLTMPNENKFATTFDFVPRKDYALDHIEWRYKTFMDYLDTVATGLLQVLNDPNMTFSIFGSPELIRKLTPTEYTYQTPQNIGPVELDFVKTVVTSDKRVYQFCATDKLRGNSNLIIVLCPRNTNRIVYRIYDYQMFVSNEIRNASNPTLPAIHGFERWKFVEYQPVQGRIQILNPTGFAEIAPNTDPIGERHMSDFNLIPQK